MSHNGTRRHYRTATDLHALDNNGIGTDQNVVADTNWLGRSWLDDTCKDRTCTDVAVFTNGRTAAQNRTHINHGTWTDFRTDVNHRAHHDNGIIANGHLIADNGTWLDTGIDITLVQQRHSRIAAVLLHHIVYIFSQVCQEWLDILPVTEEDIAKLCHFSRNSSCQFSFKGHFNSCLLHSITDKSNDFLRSHFLCSHNVSNLKIIFFLLYQNFLKIWEEMQKNEKGSGKELD